MMQAAKQRGSEEKGVHQAALLLGFLSVLNGLVGLMRDRLLAGTYGADRALDIYYAAFRIPDILFSLSLFFVASTAFIPLFLEHQERSREAARDFFDSLFTVFMAIILFLIVTAYVLMPRLVPLTVPGFDEVARAETTALARIMLFSPLLLGISNLVSGVVQSSKKFLAYALSPIAYNFGIIIGVTWFLPRFGIEGLAYGVVIGAFLHLIVQLPTLLYIAHFPRLRMPTGSNPFAIVNYSFPRAFALSLNQITLFILTALASLLGSGAIAIFNLSHNLYALPLVIIGLSYSIAAFPTLADKALKKEHDLFFSHLITSTRHILFWTLPITVLVIVLRAHIVRLVLGTGAFEWIDTRLTIASLFLFSFAIVSQSLVTLFVRGYYALGEVKRPLMFNVASSLITIAIAFGSVHILNNNESLRIALGRALRVSDIRNITFLALPLGYSLGTFVNAYLLGRSLLRMNEGAGGLKLYQTTMRVGSISIVMGLVAYASLQLLNMFISLNTFIGVLIQGGGALIGAVFLGMVLFTFMKVEEFNDIKRALGFSMKKHEN